MNFAHFKKIHEDKQVAVLKHPKGHEIKVAKNGLSKKLQAQLNALPVHMEDGGAVVDPNESREVQALQAEAARTPAAEPQSLAQQAGGLARGYGEEALGFLGQLSQYHPVAMAARAGRDFVSGVAGGPNAARAPSDPVKLPGNPDITGGQQPTEGGGNTAALNPNQNYMQRGMDEQEKGIRMAAQAEQQQAQAEERAAIERQAQLERLKEEQDDVVQNHKIEQNNFMRDYENGHINPNHYMDSKGPIGKIANVIGLILGGIGGGLGHTENQALKLMNTKIEQDIDAQKANLGKKSTLLSYNMNKYKSSMDAIAATRAQLLDINGAELKKAAAHAASPLAQARAMQAYGLIHQQYGQTMAPLLAKQAIKQHIQKGGDLATAISMIPDQHDRDKTQEELKDYESMNRFRNTALDTFDRVAELNTVSNRLNPATGKLIEGIMEPVNAALSVELARKFTEADSKAIRGVFPGLLDPRGNIAEKRVQLDRLLTNKMSYPKMEALGFRVPSASIRPFHGHMKK